MFCFSIKSESDGVSSKKVAQNGPSVTDWLPEIRYISGLSDDFYNKSEREESAPR
ncbi:MAG: hypothetical protein ACI8U4_000029 [Natronomonas sp.]|jgi:hypothetical protein